MNNEAGNRAGMLSAYSGIQNKIKTHEWVMNSQHPISSNKAENEKK